MAQYKNFYKIYALQRLNVDGFEEKVPDFYSTSIYTAEGKLTVFVQNTPQGFTIQCLLSKNSFLSDRTSLLEFLNIPTNDTIVETSAGLMAEFYVDNPSPFEPDVPWAAFQAPLLANLVMNDDSFSKFFSINDTDKISRQNNSLYVYFYDPIPVVSKHTIYVSGWNRLASRFGDLTAIVTPVQHAKGEYKIHVKVTRSTDAHVLDKFIFFFSRLLRLYNEKYTEQLDLFKAMVTGYVPLVQEISGGAPVTSTLSTMDPILFPSNVYSRSCQNPNPLVISSQEAALLPEDRKILFPPKDMDGVPARWFTCPTSRYEKDNKVYAYPGLKKLKRVVHPFHAAPCCYIKPHKEKNDEMIHLLLKPPTPDKPEKAVYMPKIRPLTSQKIINHVGQRGKLPEPLEHFMHGLYPFYDVYRVGTPTHWEDEPILAALEYYYAIREKQPYFRSPRVLRGLLLEEYLEVTLQQNYDIGIEGVTRILRDHEYIDPSRFYRLLEHFYQVTLFIFTREKDQSIRVLTPRFFQSYSWDTVPSRPVVFIYQHFGGTADSSDEDLHPQCELVGYMSSDDKLTFDFKADPKFFLLLQFATSTFQGNQLNTPLQLPLHRPFLMALDSQIIDGLGKVRALLFTESRYVAALFTPMAPLALPSIAKSRILPSRKDVEEFLSHAGVAILHIQEYQQQYVFLHVNPFTPMVFVTRYAKESLLEMPVESLRKEPFFLQYIVPEKTSIFNEICWTQRFATVLQDYLVILLSEYLDLHSEILNTKSLREIVDSFLEEKVDYESAYPLPSPSTVSPLLHQNPQLFHEDRLRLPLSFQSKMPFFLVWWLSTKAEDASWMRQFRELPSYFEFADDFQRIPFHIVQNTVTDLASVSSDHPYIKTPLAYLHYPHFKLGLVQDKVFYYYNPMETPHNHPYILLLSLQPKTLLKAGYHYLEEGRRLEAVGKPLDSYWEASDKSPKWVRKGTSEPTMAVFHSTQSNMYYGLYPFSPISS